MRCRAAAHRPRPSTNRHGRVGSRPVTRDRARSRTPVGQDTANWTTTRLAQYVGQHTGIHVTEQTVRLS